MKALITGSNGQLGRALQECTPAGVAAMALGHRELDITNSTMVDKALDGEAIDVVINAAAYTDVVRAESDAAGAFHVNDIGASVLAASCSTRRIRLIHVSTDFVFDGGRRSPYSIHDEPLPLNVYGASKLAGERKVLSALDLLGCVVRTSWLHSPFGNNFITRILAAMASRDTIAVVADETGTPTAAGSVARVLWGCAVNGLSGLHHWSDAGSATRIEYAEAIAEDAVEFGLIPSRPRILPSNTRGSDVRRPAYSVLDTFLTQEAVGIRAGPWRDGVRETVLRLSRMAGVAAA